MLRRGLALAATLLLLGAAPWSPEPWLGDLAQMRTVLDTIYANRAWLATDRELDLDALTARFAERIKSAGSDAEARAILDRMVQRIGDGHVDLQWPHPSPSAASPVAAPREAAGLCRNLGYDASQSPAGVGAALPGYQPLDNEALFPAGTVRVAKARLGIVRIGVFDPHGTPLLCEEAVRTLPAPLNRPCDETCEDAIVTRAYQRFTAAFEARLRALRAHGATVLLVDLTGNGGGSEWAEAAGRTLTRRVLTSAPLGFVRGAHWAKQWRELGERLRNAATTASPPDRARLLGWAAQADAAQTEAERHCPLTGGCPWLGRAGYATGLVGHARPGSFDGKPWAAEVFSPAQFPYHDGVWRGPVIVLVDDETWSAAEEFAALLQDNRAALILGSRTGGAGCGHTYGGTPTVLLHSCATLEVPDCARLRANGSNEVGGVVPDLLLGWRASDGKGRRIRTLASALPAAVADALKLHGWSH